MDMLEPLPYIRGPDGIDPREHGENEITGYAPMIDHICLILSFLPESQPSIAPMLQVASYLVSFPVLCRGFFACKVQESDPHALLLLYHFFRAVRILLPADECWWAQQRAALTENTLREWLIREMQSKDVMLAPSQPRIAESV
jgi:hypothetical protein